jgi:hypothetical protein
MNLSKMEYQLLKHTHIQPSEIWQKPFYEIEYLLEHLKEDHEEQEKQRQAEEKKHSEKEMSIKGMQKEMNSMTKNFNMNNLNMPKFPDISKF